jgi:hypothetical protein
LQFTVWWIVAIFLGLSGFWLPLLLHYVRDGTHVQFFNGYLRAGNFASFSIVILADGLATTLVAVNAGRSITAAGIRGLMGVFALILAFVSVAVLIIHSEGQPSVGFVLFQFALTFLAILSASYLYCFRSSEWEKSLDAAKKEQDEEVENLAKTAAAKTSDDTGVRL